MKLKSEALYFEINPGRNRPIGYIRNSYRENGKVKHQTISKIHGLSLEQLQNMKAAFDGRVMTASDMVLEHGREYGASAMFFDLAKKIGLDKMIYSRNEDWVKSALAMIIGRITYQGSKLALSRVSDISCLWEICGVVDSCETEIDVNRHCYDAMDSLLERQKAIQKKLSKKHFQDGSAILYDITSSYFEGEHEDSEIVKYGYNRDKKRGKKQITIALICTKAGCPIAVEVFSGNTTDCTTVQPKIDEIKNTYNVSNFVFVGDRGILTQKNIDACKDISNITALTHSAMRKLCETNSSVQPSLFDEDVGTEIILQSEPSVRYILRKNSERGRSEQKTRLSLVQKTEESLNDIAIPKKKTDDKTLAARAAKIFFKYKTEKYFSWSISEGKILYLRKDDVIADEEKYDGLYVLRSNVPCDMMNVSEVVETYKSLIHVEQAFRNMKTVSLEIRPVYHRTDDRIKSHVFICMLAYYLLWHFNKAVSSLYKENPKNYTQTHLIEIMKSLQKSNISIGGITTQVVANPSAVQDKILHLISSIDE